jgi:hypothetical protein
LKTRLELKVHSIKSPLESHLYNRLLKQLPSNPFLFIDLLVCQDNEEIKYFTLWDQNESLLVLMPIIIRKIDIDINATNYYDVISPYGFTGPIFSENIDLIAIKEFWKKVDKWYLKNNVVSEFIRFDLNKNRMGYSGLVEPTLNIICGKILPANELWGNFNKKVRNNVRKALSVGLNAHILHRNITLKKIEEFYEIYSHTMERVNAENIYHYDLDYFVKLITHNPDSCALAIVYMENEPISGELLLISDKIIFSFLGGTQESYFNTRPNDLLKWEVMKWAYKHGFKYYLLGGGRKICDSLYDYKKKFFPKDEDWIFYTGRKIVNNNVYNILVSQTKVSEDCYLTNFFPLYRCRQLN